MTEGMIRRERAQILSADQKRYPARLQKILKAVLDADQICVIGKRGKRSKNKKRCSWRLRTLAKKYDRTAKKRMMKRSDDRIKEIQGKNEEDKIKNNKEDKEKRRRLAVRNKKTG